MRVFLGLAEIAGYYRGLKEGFESLGHEAELICLSGHPFGYTGANDNAMVDFWRWLNARPEPSLRALRRVPRTLLFMWAASRFDIFIFSYGGSLLPGFRDLPLLKSLGKKLIFQFHGSDSRPPYLDGSVMAEDRGRSIASAIQLTHEKKRNLRIIERYADAVVNIDPQSQLLERPFIEWLRVGLPVHPSSAPTREGVVQWWEARGTGWPVRALHSPSHPEAKGSAEIRNMVERVRAQGVPLELVTIKGRPNRDVLAALATCDLVIDQLYADYGMPGLAVEAAWFGKPVVIGGYAVEHWNRALPEEARPPTWYCHPTRVEEGILSLARAPEARRRLGIAARTFVEDVWHPKKVAERYLAIAEGSFPRDWLRQPQDIDYWQGCCLSESRLQEVVAAFVKEGGRAALELGDKPAIEQVLLDLAKTARLP